MSKMSEMNRQSKDLKQIVDECDRVTNPPGMAGSLPESSSPSCLPEGVLP